MGDLPKPPDDASWSDVERTFFDAAPPEEPQPVEQPARLEDLPRPERPGTQIIVWLKATKLACRAAGGLVQRVARGTARVAVAAGARIRDTARASAEGLVAAVLSIWCVDRRRLAYAMAGVLLAGLSAGFVASRGAAPMKGVTAASEAPAAGPTVAEAAPAAISPSYADPAANVGPSANVQEPRAAVSNRRPHAHRRSVPASASTQRPLVTAFMDRETYWAHETRSAPAHSDRSFFSR